MDRESGLTRGVLGLVNMICFQYAQSRVPVLVISTKRAESQA